MFIKGENMTKLKTFYIPVLISIISIILLSACGNTQSQNTAQAKTNKNTLIIGLDSDPPQLDPQLSTTLVDRQVDQSLYNTLIDVNSNLQFVPGLATSWTVSSDEKMYTFHLRQGVTFQDGTPFNAEAVKFNLERILNPKTGSPSLSEISSIDSIKIIDDHSLQIHLKEPYAPFLSVLTDRTGMMLSPTAVKKEGKNFANHPVGTGPYKFVSRIKQESITVKRYDHYWGKKPKIKTVIYKPYTDGTTRVTNLESGNVDIINQMDYKDIDRLKHDPNITLSIKDALGFQGIMLNTKVKPLNNLKIRQAINIAIDRKAISKVVYHNGVTPAVNPFPTASWAHPTDLKVPKANIAKAKSLIKESGVTNTSFTLKITNDPQAKQLGQMLQYMLQKIGIKINLEMVEFGTLISQENSHQYQAVFQGWSGRIDPDGNSYSWFTSKGSLNNMGYSNTKVDQLLSKARSVSNQTERKALYDQTSKILWHDSPYIFLFYLKDFKAMKNDLQGFNHVPDTLIRTDTLSFK